MNKSELARIIAWTIAIPIIIAKNAFIISVCLLPIVVLIWMVKQIL